MPHRYLWYLVSLRIPCAVALSLLANPLGLWYPMWALRSISYLTSASTLLPMWYTSLAPVLCTSTPGIWYTISGVVLLRVTGPLHTYTKHLIHDTVGISQAYISSVHVVGCSWYCIPYTARYSWYYIPYVISYPLGIGIPLWVIRSISYLTSASTLLPRVGTPSCSCASTSTPGIWVHHIWCMLLRVSGPLHV